jgi:hypothetical protein
LAAKLKWILPLTFSFSMFSKRMIALVEQLITRRFHRQQLPGAEPGGGDKYQAGEGEKGARGESHCGFQE